MSNLPLVSNDPSEAEYAHIAALREEVHLLEADLAEKRAERVAAIRECVALYGTVSVASSLGVTRQRVESIIAPR